MVAYKFFDNNQQLNFSYPYQDIIMKLTEALRDQNLSAYIDLVSHFRNMSILAFDEKDLKNLERIDRIKIEFKKYIEAAAKRKMEDSSLYSIENINFMYEKNLELKNVCDFSFSSVVERICISALRRTVFKDHIPEAQTKIYYDPSRDIELAIQDFNFLLEENEICKLEIKI